MLDKLNLDLDSWGPATVLIVVGVVLAGVIGGLVCLINPDTLSFQTYLEDMQRFLLAVAGLAVARGVATGAKHVAQAKDPSFVADPSDTKGASDRRTDESGLPHEEFPRA